MRYNGAVITPQDFKNELQRRDNEELRRYAKDKLNGRFWAAKNGFDTDTDLTPANGQDE
jgi:hypothetical protein